jgi:Arc/MetJ-type ribon-helix-helix transcriptional regulator
MNKPVKRPPGRPPKEAKAMFAPITIRLSEQMHREIDAIVEEGALAGLDKSTAVRQLLAEALAARKKRARGA